MPGGHRTAVERTDGRTGGRRNGLRKGPWTFAGDGPGAGRRATVGHEAAPGGADSGGCEGPPQPFAALRAPSAVPRGRSASPPTALRQPSTALRSPPTALRSPLPSPAHPCGPFLPGHPVFDYLPGYGHSPQIRRLSSVHILGTVELSRTASTGKLVPRLPPSSGGCGIVDERSPQVVENVRLHSLCKKLSTGSPQAEGGCPQRSAASPHRCPLFGNPTHPLTASSESRHRKLPGWGVGNVGIPGDTAGENCPRPVGDVCRTFCSPQTGLVVHCLHPQGRWIKNLR